MILGWVLGGTDTERVLAGYWLGTGWIPWVLSGYNAYWTSTGWDSLTWNFHVKADRAAQTGDSLTWNFHVKADRGAQTGDSLTWNFHVKAHRGPRWGTA